MLGVGERTQRIAAVASRLQVEILRAATHPSVLAVRDVYETATHLYIVTELCSGGELFERIIAKSQTAQRARRRLRVIWNSDVGVESVVGDEVYEAREEYDRECCGKPAKTASGAFENSFSRHQDLRWGN